MSRLFLSRNIEDGNAAAGRYGFSGDAVKPRRAVKLETASDAAARLDALQTKLDTATASQQMATAAAAAAEAKLAESAAAHAAALSAAREGQSADSARATVEAVQAAVNG